MIATRLICVDGISGAGKSTTSQRLCLHLLKNGYHGRWCYEHGPDSPIWRGAERFQLMNSGITDPGAVRDLVIPRWTSFVAELEAGNATVVMESSLLHTPIGVMLAMNLDESAILSCLRDVAEIIAPLKPVSIYLVPTDVDEALKAICKQRRHDQFEAPMVALLSDSHYAKAHGLKGFEGVVHFFRHCRALSDIAFASLPMPKLAIDNSARSWKQYERQIADFLQLPPIPEWSQQVENASRFIGRYKNTTSDAELVVAADKNGLYLDDDRRTRLMPDQGDVFHINGIRLALHFKDHSGGIFHRIELDGHLPVDNPVFIRAHRD